MGKYILLILALLASTSNVMAEERIDMEEATIRSKVTYNLNGNGNSLGDNLIAYIHAKWLSFTNKIPLLYKPFAFSELFAFHDSEKRFQSRMQSLFDQTVDVQGEFDVIYKDTSKTLYVVPYFSEYPVDDGQGLKFFEMNWEDKKFRKHLKSFLKPKEEFSYLKLPKGKVSVAVYVKKGTGSDGAADRQLRPLEFPSHSYYIDQIKKINTILQGRPLYVYVFTDDRNPAQIVKQFKQAINLTNITYDYRKSGADRKYIVNDFFNMTTFNCLIRPEANLAIAAEALGDYMLVIKPVAYRMENEEVVIESVHVKVKGK